MRYGDKIIHRFGHVLVANAFIPNSDSKPQVNHINFQKDCNIVSYLEWVTNSENNLRKEVVPKTHSGVICVLQCDENKNIIREWRSIADIVNEMNYPRRTFCTYLDKNKMYKGFNWSKKKHEDLDGEKWSALMCDEKEVPVSNMGRIKDQIGRVTFGNKNGHGYMRYRDYAIHRLAMMTFEFRDDYDSCLVDHINMDKTDN